jgi:hypothetical protein
LPISLPLALVDFDDEFTPKKDMQGMQVAGLQMTCHVTQLCRRAWRLLVSPDNLFENVMVNDIEL